jgi:ribonuclease VapC
MMAVLDASALLAYLRYELGADVVKAALPEAVISTVNWAEVIQKALALEVDIDDMFQELQGLGLRIEPFTLEDGEMAGRLWSQTKKYGLSLGDRACLALGLRLGAVVLTGDRAWESLNLSIDIQIIRSQTE